MAITKRQLQVRQREKARELPKQFIASIGDRSGNVSAGGNDIYIRDLLSGQTVTAKNFVVPSTPGRLVLVERRGGDLYVVGFWRIYGTSESQSEIVPPHSHGYADGDADFVDGIRFTPLLILPYSTFTVQIFGGMVQRSDGTWLRVANQTLDLSAYQPAAGAVWAVVEVDDTGSISVSTSATQDTKELLTASNIPIVTGTPLAAIRLYDGQESIQRDPDGVNDFADLRLFAAPSPLNTLHNMLSDLQGGGEYLVGDEYYHLSHDQWEHLVKGLNADAFHTHTGVGTIYHNDLPDLQGGGEYLGLVEAYHLAKDEWEHLARGLNADDYHTHAGGGSWDGDITDIDETSSTDIGEAIADDDQGIIYNTSGTAWVRFAWSRVKTYIQALTDTLYIAISGNVSQANLATLTGGTATTLHKHAIASATAYSSTTPPTQAITVSPAAWVKVSDVFDLSDDDNGWWSDDDKRFDLPAGRFYAGAYLVASGIADQALFIAAVYKNGSFYRLLGRNPQSGTALHGTGGNALIKSDGDDYFEIYCYSSDTNYTLTGDSSNPAYCHFDIIQLSSD